MMAGYSSIASLAAAAAAAAVELMGVSPSQLSRQVVKAPASLTVQAHSQPLQQMHSPQ